MADAKISALPSATLPLGGAELLAVVQSGVTAKVALSALGASGLTVCTSSTRPSSPFQGQQIYETDTGRTLIYQSSTTGWTPPWSCAWGELNRTTVSAVPDIANVETTVIQSGAVVIPANRITLVTFHAANMQPLTKNVDTKVFVTDAANGHLALMARRYMASVVDDNSIGATYEFQFESRLALAAGTFQPKIRFIFENAGGAIRSNLNTGTDPGPAEIRVIDGGPNGAPV